MMRSGSLPKREGSPGHSTTSKGSTEPFFGVVEMSANSAVWSRNTTSAVTPTAFQSATIDSARARTQLSFTRRVSESAGSPSSAAVSAPASARRARARSGS